MNEKKSQQSAETVEGWQIARKYSALYGEVPSSFSALIRKLVQDQKEGGSISAAAEWQMLRFLRGESMKAPFYFHLKSFYPEVFDEPELDQRAMVRAFKPRDLASFLGVLYLYRRAARICNKEEFPRLLEGFHSRLDLGCHIGRSMPNVGLTVGLFVEGLSTLAKAAFMMHDLKGFTEYRRQCKLSKKDHDFSYEVSRWGCTQVQVAVNLAINLGFSTEFSNSFGKGLAQTSLGNEREDMTAYAVQVVLLWTKALLENGQPPNIVHSGNFYPTKGNLEELLAAAAETKNRGGVHKWLDKGKGSINPQEHPEIFDTSRTPSAAPEGEFDDGDAELLDEELE